MTSMTKLANPKARPSVQLVRCAVYTRKSTEEGLEQEFNSLDAQREAGEAYVKSQQHEGWTLLPECYDDGGFTGGNMDRPALRRLMADIEAGKVDLVCVYKVDRLSRSLLDFARMMEAFDKHRVSFASVTQQFNTATSMGRLVLNVLLSFAQFEREIISERTRDKIAATRRKGKWAGGTPLLGYDVDPRGQRLQVNEPEAERVRHIFDLYLEHGSLLPVVEELVRRCWVGKRWQTKAGRIKGGLPFTRTSLYRLLTNVAYVGQVRYKDEVHPGEHAAIVDPGVFQRVQTQLQQHGSSGAPLRNQFGTLLRGLLHCAPCGCAMTPAHTSKHGQKRYRYYVCSSAAKKGWGTCPSKSLPAAQVEGLVVEQIRAIGRDERLLGEVLAQVQAQQQTRTTELESEERVLHKDLTGWHAEVRQLSGQLRPGDDNHAAIARLADLQERIGQVEGRVQKVREQLRAVHASLLDDAEATRALALFDPVWETLTPAEQARVLQLLLARVDYDGRQGKVTIAFHASGIQTLAQEFSETRQERRA